MMNDEDDLTLPPLPGIPPKFDLENFEMTLYARSYAATYGAMVREHFREKWQSSGRRRGMTEGFTRSPLDPGKRDPVEHELKVWPEQFLAITSGAKCHEVRKFDRDFRVGDTLLLCEYFPNQARYSGRNARVRVTHITKPGTFGLPSDVGVLSLKKAYQRAPMPEREIRPCVALGQRECRRDADGYCSICDGSIFP